jgi:hypothetical protein
VLATLSQSRAHELSARGISSALALTGGYHLAFWIAAALVAGSIVVAAATLRSREADATAVEGLHVLPGEEDESQLDSRAA